ncbi:MAG TPA: DUF488 domain-containing protein [Candidatus Hydrogenedentes bacterium]|nr:DUF488 domain-containing protein [Candidatus Hydrogenedentota bacterium]
MKSAIYTIGHSNHEIAAFIALLHQHSITALADVRSHPYSQYVPQYSLEPLKETLTSSGIAYVFLGKELGARSINRACYKQGRVQYERLAKEPVFLVGIDRIIQGMSQYRIALMCAEKDPIKCHRALLVGRTLFEKSIPVNHILPDGSLETHEELESRLLSICRFPEGDMFKSREEFVADAYLMQGERVAYQDEAMSDEEQVKVS